MKPSTSFALALVAFSFAAACSSSSEGDGTGGSSTTQGAGGDGTTTATTTTTGEGAGDAGGGNAGGGDAGGGGGGECENEPLDCIGGEFAEDENGCLVCNYFQCPVQVCADGGSGQCVAQGIVICDAGEGDCGELDYLGNGLTCPDGFVCADGTWGCGCPAVYRNPGTPCGEVGRACEVASPYDCGPPEVTITCTEDGWADDDLDGGGEGGSDCG